MARGTTRREKESSQSPKGKMTFVMFQLEGNDETLQKGFRSMEIAFERLSPSVRREIQIFNDPKHLQENDLTKQSEEIVETDMLDSEAQNEQEENISTKQPKQKKYKTPSVLTDLNFTEGDRPLRDYFHASGNPKEVTKRYLLIAAWLKRYRDINEIGDAHIYTALKFLNLSVPVSVIQAIRDMKSRNSYFSQGSAKGFYEINHIGLEAVRQIEEAANGAN